MSKASRQDCYEFALAEVRNDPYPRPNKYIKYYLGSDTTSKTAWCGMFVYYVLCKKLNARYLLKDCTNTAYIPTVYNWAKKYNKFTTKPQLCDLVIFDWGYNDGVLSRDHIGFFIRDNGDGTIETIEGNTSSSSDGNGNCVQVRTRDKKYVCKYVALDYDFNITDLTEDVKKKCYTGTLPTITLSINIKNQAQIKLWQKYLNWYGNYKLTIDGFFGLRTLEATKKFQQEQGLVVDGIAGKLTLAKAKTIKK